MAGQGGGKTHLEGLIGYELITQFPNVHGFIGANTYVQLSDSTLYRIKEVWKNYLNCYEYNPNTKEGHYVVDKKPPVEWKYQVEYKTWANKIAFDNGCVVYTGSLDNYKAHDGKEFAWAILDETKDTREEAVKEVILGRLREKGLYIKNGMLDSEGESFNPLYIFTSPAKVDWLNELFELDKYIDEINETVFSKETYFHKEDGNKLITISSTYHNQENLPENFIENQIETFSATPELIDMLIYGYPFSKSGGEFYKQFDRQRHTGQLEYRDNIPIHLTFDFNYHPYVALLVIQLYKNNDLLYVDIIDEICLGSPRNTAQDACKEFKSRYPQTAGMFIYGDPSGRNRDTRMQQGGNDYTNIFKELNSYNPHDRVLRKHPPVALRGNFENTLLTQDNIFKVVITIDEAKCPKTIADLTYTKENSEGLKDKAVVKDPKTGISFQKYGHCSDSLDYFLCKAFETQFREYIGKRERILT